MRYINFAINFFLTIIFSAALGFGVAINTAVRIKLFKDIPLSPGVSRVIWCALCLLILFFLYHDLISRVISLFNGEEEK